MIDHAVTSDRTLSDRRSGDVSVINEPEIAPELDKRSGELARYDARHKVLWLGSMPVPFRVGENRNGELLDLLSVAIRQLRSLGPSEPCPLRRSEHRLLAQLLDLDDVELRSDLRRSLCLSRRQAGDTVSLLRRVRADEAISLD